MIPIRNACVPLRGVRTDVQAELAHVLAQRQNLGSMEFALHSRLAADTTYVTDWPLSRVLLMEDARFPWLVLVPRRVGASELHDLPSLDCRRLIQEIAQASLVLKDLTGAAKINVGALGNLVPQLHIHVVARCLGDAAWPGPVWGHGVPVAYSPTALSELLARLSEQLARPLP
jgi:diadenosine tetraphosphate (Ap4A) HIT family hydrolase